MSELEFDDHVVKHTPREEQEQRDQRRRAERRDQQLAEREAGAAHGSEPDGRAAHVGRDERSDQGADAEDGGEQAEDLLVPSAASAWRAPAAGR